MAPVAVMMAISIAMMAVQTAMQIKAQKAAQKAREQAAERQRAELARQQGRDNIIAMEQKADVRAKADRAMATMLSQAADNGSSAAAISRMAGGIGGVSGTDLARIEGNRQEGQAKRKSEWVNVNGMLEAHAEQTKYSIMGTAAAGIGNMASSAASYGMSSSSGYQTTPLSGGGGGGVQANRSWANDLNY
jgi:hypothetical protein